jgi:biopolymer transport protein ExbD
MAGAKTETKPEEKTGEVRFPWRGRLRKRRGKIFKPIAMRELNLVAMMDMLTILLVFLLKSYSVSALSLPVGEEIKVPMSSHLAVPKEAVKLTVTKVNQEQMGVIAVDENKILALDSKKMRELEMRSQQRIFLIRELFEALRKKADIVREIAKLNAKVTFDGKIMIIADRDTPYWLVTQVLYTAAEAGFDRYNLVAIRQQQ